MNLKFLRYKNLSLYLISSVITTIIGLVINPFLSLGLSVDDFAIIGYYSAFATLFLPLISFNLNNYYSRKYYIVDEIKRKEIYQTLLSIFLILGCISFLILFFLYFIYHQYFVKSIQFSPFALLSFLPLYFSSFYNLYLLDLRFNNQVKKYCLLTIANSVVAALISLLLVYLLNYGAIGRLSSILIVGILFAVISLKFSRFKFKINTDITKDAFIFCWPLAFSSILTFFFMGIDRPLLEDINDNYNLGLYNIGIQISGYITIFSTIVFQTFNPHIYMYSSKGQHKKLFTTFFYVMMLTIVPVVLFILFSEQVIAILTYGKYVEAKDFANILCLKSISYTFAFLISDSMIGYGLTKNELINKLLSSIIVFCLYIYLINNWGFYGAAWGQFFSWLVLGVVNFIVLIYTIKFKMSDKI